MAYSETDPNRAAVAHVLRRATLAPHPDRLDSLSGLDDAVSFVLDAPPLLDSPPVAELDEVVAWWIHQMIRPDAGIHERMTWFWHTILTSSAEAGYRDHHVSDQLQLLRTNALGNFRTLLHAFTTDALLLLYLNADGSEAYNPNENLARELMELFTVGKGTAEAPNYTQDDVAAAARALAGWSVDNAEDDPDDDLPTTVRFYRENAFVAPLLFLGEQNKWDRQLVVDRLCDDPATAKRISSILWQDLVGVGLSDDQATDLGKWWQEKDLEIRPLVERILASKGFGEARLNRPRSGLEWVAASHAALGVGDFDLWSIQDLQQTPYQPPNVSGWPRDNRWLGVGPISARTQRAWAIVSDGDEDFDPPVTSTDDILAHLGLSTLSDRTREAMAAMDRRITEMEPDARVALRWKAALCTPEFNLQ